MAFTAVAALASGAAVTAPLVLAAVAQVGIAMTIVGAVTGNKDLLKFGGALSLVGGIGGLAAGALAEGGAVVAGEVASAGAADAAGGLLPQFGTDAAYQAGLQGADLGATAVTAGNAVGNQLPDLSQMPGNQAMSSDPSMPADTAIPSADAGIVMQPPTMDGSQTLSAGAPAPSAAITPPTPNALGLTDMSAGYQAPNNAYGSVGNYGARKVASGGYLSQITGWMNGNKDLVQLGGNALSGMQKQNQFDANLDLNNRRLSQTGYGSATARYYPGIISRRT